MSRLLHRVVSPAAADMASIKMWPLRRTIHVAARTSDLPKSQQLQFDIEGVISVVGGKMVVADMRFTRDSFDYWRNAAIPSNSIVKELASTWANMNTNSANCNVPFKFCAERTMGKKMEDFLQKVVADVEHRITEEEFNPLEGRKVDVRLVAVQEVMPKEDINPDSKQNPSGGLHVDESADKQESMAQKLENLEAKPGSGRSIDAQVADEPGGTAREGKPESEQSSGLQELLVKEQKAEDKHVISRKLDVQLAGEHEPAAKEFEGMKGSNRSAKPPSNEKDLMQQGAQAQIEDATNMHVDKKESERETKPGATHRVLQRGVNVQKSPEKEKKLEVTQYRILKKEGVKAQNTDQARKQNYGAVKDHPYQQTDNIIQTTRRIGKKIVHIYSDKGSARRASL